MNEGTQFFHLRLKSLRNIFNPKKVKLKLPVNFKTKYPIALLRPQLHHRNEKTREIPRENTKWRYGRKEKYPKRRGIFKSRCFWGLFFHLFHYRINFVMDLYNRCHGTPGIGLLWLNIFHIRDI